MNVERRLKRIEKQLGDGYDIKRTVLVLCGPERENETDAEKAERRVRIDECIQKAIRRDPTNPFIFII